MVDGWFPQVAPGPDLEAARAVIDEAAVEAGRDPRRLGVEGRVHFKGDVSRLVDDVGAWGAAGASHVSIHTMDAGLVGVGSHLEVLADLSGRLELAGG